MNKKTVLAVGLCVVLLVCSVIYFRPLPLSSCIPENGSLLLHSNTFGVQNGKPYIHSEAYDHITEDQKEKIMELAQAYTYNRTLKDEKRKAIPRAAGSHPEGVTRAARHGIYSTLKQKIRTLLLSRKGSDFLFLRQSSR